MINKEIIIKSLNDAIVKCGQRLRLSNLVHETFNRFASTIRKRKTEKAILVNDDGEILKSKNGYKDGVNIANEVLKAYADNGNQPIHIDHNHPNVFEDDAPSFLSIPDMDWVIAQHPDTGSFLVKSIGCEDSYNHSRMTLVRGDNYSVKDKKSFDKAKNYLWNDVGIETLLLHFSTTKRNFEKLWNDIPNKPKVNSKEYEKLMSDIRIKANNMSLEEEGFFKEFSKAQELFRKANCKLNFEWVED